MTYIKTHAPYAHLVRSGNHEYNLYILIPILSDEKIAEEMVEYSNGTTLINFTVGPDDQDNLNTRYLKKIRLTPESSAVGYTFDPRTFSIRISCKNQQKETRRTILRYADYMPTRVDDFSDDDEKVHNRPYMYLTNPNAVMGNDTNGFSPYCMFYLKGFNKATFLGYEYPKNQPYTQGYTQEIKLEEENNTVEKWIDPTEITCNGVEYEDTNSVIGSFYVEITILTGGKKRRGRLRNADSDTNPSSFIDFLS